MAGHTIFYRNNILHYKSLFYPTGCKGNKII